MRESEKLEHLRHSLAHLLAAAILELFPGTKNTIGPAVDNGFYYDFDFSASSGPVAADLPKIEKKMREILKTWNEFFGKEVLEQEARDFFQDNSYKQELINEITEKGEKITLYTSGEFTDLCRGGHVENMKKINPEAFKLSHIAGAYWRGDEKNKMLTRIYGLAFASKKELDEYLTMMEEAKKRDHRKLGKELGLFVFSELVGPGLPIYTPKGNIVRDQIINFSRELNRECGYEEVHTPNINKAELFKISGHYEKFRDDMLKVSSHHTEEEYFLKPMNCPQHTQIFNSETRSYRDLPIRLSDFANLYRDEKPGELSGLTRLRYFAQDDGHCFCRENQIKEEFSRVLAAIKKALKTYGMEYWIRFSLRDPDNTEDYLGDSAVWERSQAKMRELLEIEKIPFVEALGEAAFYGPKMDVMVKDAIGREWQISTIQLDFNMPARFGLKYADADGKEKTPVMIHRALIGSPERFLGILIEHYAGAFPIWLSPVQVKVLPIGENHHNYAKKVFQTLKEIRIRVELDDSNESLGKKIRNWKLEKIPYALVIGDKEVKEEKLTVESRDPGQLGQMDLDDFVKKIKKEVENKG
jgi:threonyl-tRNA synthetase